MSNTPEGKVKKAVKKLLDQHGAFHTWPVPSGFGESMLDCVGHHRGDYFEIETKAPGEKPTARQQYRIDLLTASDSQVFVIGEKIVEYNAHASDYSGMKELAEWLKRK